MLNRVAYLRDLPGFSIEATEFLLRERSIWGEGVDTIWFDPAADYACRSHRALLAADKWAPEAVANLDQLPPVGATLFIGAPKVRGAAGGPVRLLAMWRTWCALAVTKHVVDESSSADRLDGAPARG